MTRCPGSALLRYIDLLDPMSYLDGQPFDQMLYLQEHDPVHWHPEPDGGPGFWALTRYDDIKRVQGNPGLFSSFPTVTVPDGTSLGDGVNYCHLIMTNPPQHTVRRRHLTLDPMVYDVTRSPNPHFGFGAGRHHCLGSHLVRQELRTMFRQLLIRLPDIEPAGEATYLRDDPIIPPNLVGPRALPVRFTPTGKLAGERQPEPSTAP